MIKTIKSLSNSHLFKISSVFFCLTFSLTLIISPTTILAQPVSGLIAELPTPGAMLSTSGEYIPTLLRGVTIKPENPLMLDFIFDTGQDDPEGENLQKDAEKMIKYFLAGLTVPESEIWVNLSPYEEDKTIPESLGSTEMGVDLLGQDYILKQITASLMHPEKNLGRKFWNRVYERAYEEYGTTEIPINTFVKVWIIPDEAIIWEKDNNAMILESHLKVMLEEDYSAILENLENEKLGTNHLSQDDVEKLSNISSEVVKEILLPEIEREINTGKNFAQLRQVYNALILAFWYKNALRESLLGQIYVDKNKTKGVDVSDKKLKLKVFDHYLSALTQGVYNFSRDDYDQNMGKTIKRRYFSGGVSTDMLDRFNPKTKAIEKFNLGRYIGELGTVASPTPDVFSIPQQQVAASPIYRRMSVSTALTPEAASPISTQDLTRFANNPTTTRVASLASSMIINPRSSKRQSAENDYGSAMGVERNKGNLEFDFQSASPITNSQLGVYDTDNRLLAIVPIKNNQAVVPLTRSFSSPVTTAIFNDDKGMVTGASRIPVVKSFSANPRLAELGRTLQSSPINAEAANPIEINVRDASIRFQPQNIGGTRSIDVSSSGVRENAAIAIINPISGAVAMKPIGGDITEISFDVSRQTPLSAASLSAILVDPENITSDFSNPAIKELHTLMVKAPEINTAATSPVNRFSDNFSVSLTTSIDPAGKRNIIFQAVSSASGIDAQELLRSNTAVALIDTKTSSPVAIQTLDNNMQTTFTVPEGRYTTQLVNLGNTAAVVATSPIEAFNRQSFREVASLVRHTPMDAQAASPINYNRKTNDFIVNVSSPAPSSSRPELRSFELQLTPDRTSPAVAKNPQSFEPQENFIATMIDSTGSPIQTMPFKYGKASFQDVNIKNISSPVRFELMPAAAVSVMPTTNMPFANKPNLKSINGLLAATPIAQGGTTRNPDFRVSSSVPQLSADRKNYTISGDFKTADGSRPAVNEFAKVGVGIFTKGGDFISASPVKQTYSGAEFSLPVGANQIGNINDYELKLVNMGASSSVSVPEKGIQAFSGLENTVVRAIELGINNTLVDPAKTTRRPLEIKTEDFTFTAVSSQITGTDQIQTRAVVSLPEGTRSKFLNEGNVAIVASSPLDKSTYQIASLRSINGQDNKYEATISSPVGREMIFNVIPTNRMLSSSSVRNDFAKTGGIDLNPFTLNLDVQKEGGGIKMPLPQRHILDNLKIDGIAPNIINIAPVSTPLLFGQVDQKKTVEPNLLSRFSN